MSDIEFIPGLVIKPPREGAPEGPARVDDPRIEALVVGLDPEGALPEGDTLVGPPSMVQERS